MNGVKTNYFSKLFLKCQGSLSAKTRLSIVNKAVTDVQKKYYNESEQFEVQMETKSIINQELSSEGALDVPVVIEKIFKEHPQMKEEVQEKLEKYNLAETRWNHRIPPPPKSSQNNTCSPTRELSLKSPWRSTIIRIKWNLSPIRTEPYPFS